MAMYQSTNGGLLGVALKTGRCLLSFCWIHFMANNWWVHILVTTMQPCVSHQTTIHHFRMTCLLYPLSLVATAWMGDPNGMAAPLCGFRVVVYDQKQKGHGVYHCAVGNWENWEGLCKLYQWYHVILPLLMHLFIIPLYHYTMIYTKLYHYTIYTMYFYHCFLVRVKSRAQKIAVSAFGGISWSSIIHQPWLSSHGSKLLDEPTFGLDHVTSNIIN